MSKACSYRKTLVTPRGWKMWYRKMRRLIVRCDLPFKTNCETLSWRQEAMRRVLALWGYNPM